MKATLTKTILLVILILLIIRNSNAQSTNWWRTVGNPAVSGDFIGTTNNSALNFRTNNIQQMTLDANGNLKINSLIGTGNRIIMSSPTGQLIAIPQGSANQVLFGNGTWGSIPTPTNLGAWNTNGNKLFYNNGYVGIGISNPQFPLDVIGDARISNNLYVGGGIIITDKVSATDKVTTGALEADSIKMGLTKAIYGLTRIEGDIDAKNDLTVTGDAAFNSTLKASQGIVFDNFNNGFKVVSNPLGGGNFIYGKTVGATTPAFVPCAAQPQSFYNHQFGGTLQIFDADNAGNYVSGSGLLNIQAWQGGSSIDASIGGNTNGGGLLLNYFCGNNTIINTGANGGTVIMGKKVTAEQSVKIGYDGTSNVDPNTALTIHQSSNNSNGLVFKTSNSSLKMISIENSNFPKSPFTVLGDGRTYIGDKTQLTGNYNYAKLTVFGLAVASEVVVTMQNWADNVFDKNYTLPALKDVESYYLQNHHLPEIPSEKNVLENGVNVGEMNRLLLKKIEELTLYVVQQQKEINALKAGKK